MHTIRNSSEGGVSLFELVDQLHLICLSTQGRIRRLNRFLMGVDLIMSVAKEGQRTAIEERLSQVAADCGLAEPKSQECDASIAGLAMDAARMEPGRGCGALLGLTPGAGSGEATFR